MQRAQARQRLLSNELPGREKRESGFPPVLRNDGEFCASLLKIEDGVSRISLRKEGLFGLQVNQFSSHSRLFKEGGEFKGHASHLNRCLPVPDASSREQFGRIRGRFRFEVARTSIASSGCAKSYTSHLRWGSFFAFGALALFGRWRRIGSWKRRCLRRMAGP